MSPSSSTLRRAVISLPISVGLPVTFEPLIVTRGVSKYERTHDEPFRSAIQGADAALDAASSFLCVGYGFRDHHIQPKIVERWPPLYDGFNDVGREIVQAQNPTQIAEVALLGGERKAGASVLLMEFSRQVQIHG